jgi:penicillin-binding protein 2
MRPKRILLLLLAIVLAACAQAPVSQPGGPTAPPSMADAESMARLFLGAWAAGNFDEMYGYISPRSQITSREAFSQAYAGAEEKLTLAPENPRSYNINTDLTQRQGSTVIINYAMTFNSQTLGEFTDSDRLLRLIITPRGWRVAWSTMDIFEGMAGGAYLQLTRTVARRGTIYDRNGRVMAQDGVNNYAVRLLTRAYPGNNPDECYRRLAMIFRVQISDLAKYKSEIGSDNGYTIGNISESDLQTVRQILDQSCLIEYRRQNTRFYFGGNIAAQTIGFVSAIQAGQEGNYPDLPPDALVGQLGIERTYQRELAGTSGAQLQIFSPDNILVRTIYERPAVPGQDVTLSLDRDFQIRVEQAIADGYNAANWSQFSSGAGLVVLDVKTGDVLAMASFPTLMPDAFRLGTSFDFTTNETYIKKEATRNRTTEGDYFPGSVMKIATTAAAVATGAFSLSETVDCRGTFLSPDDGRTLTDWIYLEPGRDPNYHSVINLEQGLTSSCDVYYWTIAVRLNEIDPFAIAKYSNMLGLGVRTGIEGIYEVDGYVPDPDTYFARTNNRWGVGAGMSIAIGQGDVKVTVLQIARMTATVAADGMRHTPVLLKQIGLPGQPPSLVANPPAPVKVDIATEVFEGIDRALCEVTTNRKLGTAQWVYWNFNQEAIRVCGKTGTAQSGTPYPHGWFTAFAGPNGQPPEIAIAAVVLNSREGSETAAPIVRRVIEAYYGLPFEPWPDFWSLPYELLPTPGLGEGGGGIPRR